MAQQLARDTNDGTDQETIYQILDGEMCWMLTRWDADRVSATAVAFVDNYNPYGTQDTRRCVIEMFAVETKLKKQGTALFVHLLRQCMRWRVECIALKCDDRVKGFWERIGFSEEVDSQISDHSNMISPRLDSDNVMAFRVELPVQQGV